MSEALASVDLDEQKQIALLSKRLKKVIVEAMKRRLMLDIRISFSGAMHEVSVIHCYVSTAKVLRGSDKTSLDVALAELSDKLARELPKGWALDYDSLAEQLLHITALSHTAIRSFAFRADFRRIADKKLFGCWVDGMPQGHSHENIATIKSVDATAAVAEALALAEAAIANYPHPVGPPPAHDFSDTIPF